MNKFYNFTAEKKTKNEGGLYSGKTITPAKVAEAGVDVGANAAKGGGHVFGLKGETQQLKQQPVNLPLKME